MFCLLTTNAVFSGTTRMPRLAGVGIGCNGRRQGKDRGAGGQRAKTEGQDRDSRQISESQAVRAYFQGLQCAALARSEGLVLWLKAALLRVRERAL